MKYLLSILLLLPLTIFSQDARQESSPREKERRMFERERIDTINRWSAHAAEEYVIREFKFQEKERVRLVLPAILENAVIKQDYAFEMGAELLTPEEESGNALILVVPKRFDLKKYIPAVGKQSADNDCSAYAAAYYMKTISNNVTLNIDNTCEDFIVNKDRYVFDPAFIFASCNMDYRKKQLVGDCKGIELSHAIYQIIHEGAVTKEEVNRYTGGRGIYCPAGVGPELGEKAKQHCSKEAVEFPFIVEKAKQQIRNKRPVGIVARVDDNFFTRGEDEKYTSGRVPFIWRSYQFRQPISEKLLQRHSMVIVGYDDSLAQFLVINSLGEGWGNKGYFYLPYSFAASGVKIDFGNRQEQTVPVIEKMVYLIEPVADTGNVTPDVLAPGPNLSPAKPADMYSGSCDLQPGQYFEVNDWKIGCQQINYQTSTVVISVFDKRKDSLFINKLPIKIGDNFSVTRPSDLVKLKVAVKKIATAKPESAPVVLGQSLERSQAPASRAVQPPKRTVTITVQIEDLVKRITTR